LHLGLREYDPHVGQFLEKDPAGFSGGVNLYAYVGGDPVNHIDSTGTDGIDFDFMWVVTGLQAVGAGIGMVSAVVGPVVSGLPGAVRGAVRDAAILDLFQRAFGQCPLGPKRHLYVLWCKEPPRQSQPPTVKAMADNVRTSSLAHIALAPFRRAAAALGLAQKVSPALKVVPPRARDLGQGALKVADGAATYAVGSDIDQRIFNGRVDPKKVETDSESGATVNILKELVRYIRR